MSMLDAGTHSRDAREAFGEVVRQRPGTRSARQAAVDDMCAWLRLILDPVRSVGPGQEELDDLAREVLHFLTSRLRVDPSDESSFSGLNLDLSGAYLESANFSGSIFSGGRINFARCRFSSDWSFTGSRFSGAKVTFSASSFEGTASRGSAQFAECQFAGSEVSFHGATFRGGFSCFDDTDFSSGFISFSNILLVDSVLSFVRAQFSGSDVTFAGAVFERGLARFRNCRIRSGSLRFDDARIRTPVCFDGSVVEGGLLAFDGSDVFGGLSLSKLELKAGEISMRHLTVSGDQVDCSGLLVNGGRLSIDDAKVYFGELNMSETSFLSGAASMANVDIRFDGLFRLPWGTFSSTRSAKVSPSFDRQQERVFTFIAARYRPGVVVNWGPFDPLPEPAN